MVALDGAGNAYLTMETSSSDIPTVNAYDSVINDCDIEVAECPPPPQDAFLVKISGFPGLEFNDFALGGMTEVILLSGTVVSIQDSALAAPNDGVFVTTGAFPAQIQACQGASQVLVDVEIDTEVSITCGSWTVKVDNDGTVILTFIDDGETGETATITLDKGNEITVDDGVISAPDTNSESVVVIIGDESVTVEPGEVKALTKEACKKAGWENLGFRNQGGCVSNFVNG